MTARTRLMTWGAVVAVIGGAVAVLYFFQPWRSCDYEDTSAGCVMLPHDAAAMFIAAMVFGVGITIVAAGLLVRRSPAWPDRTP